MYQNVISSLFRKIGKKDIYTLINLTGLSVGLAVFLMIFLYVADELRFDRYHHNPEEVFRLLYEYPGTGSAAVIHTGALYDYLDNQVAGVSHLARLVELSDVPVNVNNRPLLEAGFAAADPDFLHILSIELIEGDLETALQNPHDIIISKTTAERYFGQDDPMGQIVNLYNTVPFTITGISKPNPDQSHFQYNMLCNLEGLLALNPGFTSSWDMQSASYYLRLEAGENPRHVAERIQTILWDVREQYKDHTYIGLQPLTDIRLKSDHIGWDKALTGDMGIVAIFSVTAILILFLACFNFINLSMAGAVSRRREIGIRKVLGANRIQLIRQFLLEAFALSFIAMLVALLLVELLLPLLNNISGKNLAQNYFNDPLLIIVILALLIVTPLLAGAYPAGFMSRFQPVAVIKGNQMITSVKGIRKKRVQLRMRQFLLLLQFAVSTALIVSSIIIYWQMNYMTSRHPGFERENMISVVNPFEQQAPARAAWLREQLLSHPDVEMVSLSHNAPAVDPMNYARLSYEGRNGQQQMHMAGISCDASYFEVLQSRILEGRNFDPDLITDPANSVIINETAARRLDVDNPIGTVLNGLFDGQPRQVIGVVEDIFYTSLHSSVRPMAFYISPEIYPQNFFNIIVRFREGQHANILAYLEEIWMKEAPEWPLEYYFTEELIYNQYDNERRVLTIVIAFAVLAIILSALGLVGLAIYASTTRIKEIGIRKVLGASVNEIIRMVSNEFGLLVILANLIAWPVTYIFTTRWLDGFAYRADIGWLIYVIPAVALYLLAVTIIASISYRAATINPVESLRNPG